MKRRLDPQLKLAQVKHPFATVAPDAHNNCYRIKTPQGRTLTVITSNGDGWDHVSVSVDTSTHPPTWDEMCYIKDLFFGPEETVIQYHPPQADYINLHPGCLHLWRPQDQAIPLPPLYMV